MRIKHFNKLFFMAVFGFLFGLLPVSNAVAANLTAPQESIKAASNSLKEKLQDETFAGDFKKINVFVLEVINPMVDFNRVSALVLGKLWKKATREEKLQFKKEFQTLLVRSYARAFVEFKEWSVRFLPLKMAPDAKKVIVKTEILQPGIQPLAVNYRMVLFKGKWKAYDIMIEGVSLVTNYRTSIKNEFKQLGSLKAVIDKLATTNAKALAPVTYS
jgi:phospholipid transport system substrate-binding protein